MEGLGGLRHGLLLVSGPARWLPARAAPAGGRALCRNHPHPSAERSEIRVLSRDCAEIRDAGNLRWLSTQTKPGVMTYSRWILLPSTTPQPPLSEQDRQCTRPWFRPRSFLNAALQPAAFHKTARPPVPLQTMEPRAECRMPPDRWPGWYFSMDQITQDRFPDGISTSLPICFCILLRRINFSPCLNYLKLKCWSAI